MSSVVLLLAASVCVAQQPANPPEGQPGQEKRPDRREMMRQHADREGGLLQTLTKQLNLDEAQQAEVKKFLDEQRTKEFETRTSMRMPQESIDKMATLREEMRKAREAGDNARMQQIREELMAMQKDREQLMKPVQEKLAELQDQLHDQILTILRDDQKAKFEEVWEEHSERAAGFGGTVRTPRALKSQIDRLKDLTPEQKQQIDALFDQFRKASHEQQPQAAGGLKQRRETTKKLYDDVFALLTPEQKEKVEKALQGERGMRHPGGKPGKPGHPGEPGQPGAAGEGEQQPPPEPEGGEPPTE